MPEARASFSAAFKLFPGRICIVSAQREAPEEGSAPRLGVFWVGDAKDWGTADRIKARERGPEGDFVPKHRAHPPPTTLPAASLGDAALPRVATGAKRAGFD